MNTWQKPIHLLLALIFTIGLLGPASVPVDITQARLQPMLAQLAATEPNQWVSVIVQAAGERAQAEALTLELGGEITRDLHIINAFAAELPANALTALGADPAVRWISLDAPVIEAGKGGGGDTGSSGCAACVDTSSLLNAYIQSIGADRLWNEAPYLQGQGITVAVVDSGIAAHKDLGDGRILAKVGFNNDFNNTQDWYGHGTLVAGTIGGDGTKSVGEYIGVAPGVNLVNVKVSDDQGAGSTSDVIAGLQWVYDNKAVYNIRVVNLSLNSSVVESYHTSPLDAAVEILWFSGVVVVVAGGNNGSGPDNGIMYPPANDPFVISVGAADDMGTADTGDDALATFSAYGTTADGFAKPDLAAPGGDIISLMASKSSLLPWRHPDHIVNRSYFHISGTSMASSVTAGAVALLLQDEPGLTPDQVKYRLMATSRPFGPGAGAGYLDAYAAVHGTTTESANTGTEASQLLWTGSDPIVWESVNWNSVNWNSVNWNSVNWNSVHWDD